MKIDSRLISKLEQLAHLDLSSQERENIQNDLNKILVMVEKLEELDTEEVKPLVHVTGEANIWREDVVRGQMSREAALRNAPNEDGTYFRVPKMM